MKENFHKHLVLTLCALAILVTACVQRPDYYLSARQQYVIMTHLEQQGLQFVQQGAHLRIIIPSDDYFPVNEAQLDEDKYPVMDDLARLLRSYGSIPLNISGHTDNMGTIDHRIDLSKAQASSIAEYLYQQGIMPKDLKVVGMADKQSIASDGTVLGSAFNRRVEISTR